MRNNKPMVNNKKYTLKQLKKEKEKETKVGGISNRRTGNTTEDKEKYATGVSGRRGLERVNTNFT